MQKKLKSLFCEVERGLRLASSQKTVVYTKVLFRPDHMDSARLK
jgi:hypothetical protein